MDTVTKENINTKHSSTKLTPIQAPLQKDEGQVYRKLLDKTKKIEPKYKIGCLVRDAQEKKVLKVIQKTGPRSFIQSQKLSVTKDHLII